MASLSQNNEFLENLRKNGLLYGVRRERKLHIEEYIIASLGTFIREKNEKVGKSNENMSFLGLVRFLVDKLG
jgi:hypothetical protein